jgi:hypothetical protein
MVDALRRALHLVVSRGSVMDIHPTAADASLEVGAACTGRAEAGDAPGRHAAAAGALAAVVGDGLFTVDRTHAFTFYTYGDSAEELREYIEENWRNATIDAETMRRTREALRANPRAKPRVREHVQVTMLRPATSSLPRGRD